MPKTKKKENGDVVIAKRGQKKEETPAVIGGEEAEGLFKSLIESGAVREDDSVVLVMRDGQTVALVEDGEQRWADPSEIEVRETDDENEVELSFSSENPVLVYGTPEILSHRKQDASFKRLKEVGAVLKNHDSREIVGMPVKVWLDEKERKGRMLMRFGTTEKALEAKQEVLVDKTLRGVSVGFVVREWVWLKDEDTVYAERFVGPAWVAAKWEALEASLTPTPADASVGVNREVSTKKERENMPKEKKTEEAISEVTPAPAVRAEPAPSATPAKVIDVDEVRATAQKAERERASEIGKVCRANDIDEEKTNGFIDNGTSVDQVRKEILDDMSQRSKPVAGDVAVVADGRATFAKAAVEAIHVRAGNIQRGDAKDGGAEMANLTMKELARQCLERAGLSTRGNDLEMVARAMAGPSINSSDIEAFSRGELIGGSTSDFTYILAAVVNKELLDSYNAANVTYPLWTKQGSLNDFKAAKRIKMAEAADLEEIKELGEYKSAFFSESQESIQLATYGKKYGISRQAIINDDLDAFQTVPRKFGRAAARLPNKLAIKVLMANAALNDGSALFSTTHKNYSAAAANAMTTLATAEVGLKNMLKLFRLQQAMISAKEGDDYATDYLNLIPKVLLVGPTNEFIASQAMRSASSLADDKNAGVTNPLAGRAQVVVEPNLENTNWTGYSTLAYYMFADPSDAPVIEVAFLQGNRAPYMEETQQTDVDGRIWKVRLDVTAAAIDYVGAVKEKGEA